jgi:hypothetical protein
MTPLGVFTDAFPGHKMWVNLLTAPSIQIIWTVTHSSTNRAHRCLTSVIKWVPKCTTRQAAALWLFSSPCLTNFPFRTHPMSASPLFSCPIIPFHVPSELGAPQFPSGLRAKEKVKFIFVWKKMSCSIGGGGGGL